MRSIAIAAHARRAPVSPVPGPAACGGCRLAIPVLAALLASSLPALAQDEAPTPTPTPAVSTAATPPPDADRRRVLGWRETGLAAPLVRWHAGAGSLLAVSDRYGGNGEPGWLFQLSPRLLLERPPARISGWLAYEPALQAQSGLPPRRESRFDLEQRGREPVRPSELETKVQHQGSFGLSIGDGVGARLAAEGKRRVTLDQLRSEQEGLVEHVETMGSGALEWVTPDRWTLAARASASEVRYPHERVRLADHDRVDGALEATARFHLRMTGLARLTTSDKRYRRARETDGDLRRVQTWGATAHMEAQPMPSVSFRGGAGLGVRRDPDTTIDLPMTAGMTIDFRRRFRTSLDAGTALEDSLWRGNRHVRVFHASARAGASLFREWDAALTGGLITADYPRREEIEGPGSERRSRNDVTWGAGGEISCRPAGRVRATLSFSHTERRSSFPGYDWEENRCVLSAHAEW